MIEAGLELQQPVFRQVAHAFREDDQARAFVERRDHPLHRILFGIAVVTVAVDQHGIEHVAAEKRPQPVLQPVVRGRNRAGAAAQKGGQNGPHKREVGVRGVVGEIDPLARDRFDTLPDRPRRGDHPNHQHEPVARDDGNSRD